MPNRLFISHILNCEPFREIEMAEIDHLGWYQLVRKTRGCEEKMFFFSQDYHIGDVCFPHQYPKKREDNKF